MEKLVQKGVYSTKKMDAILSKTNARERLLIDIETRGSFAYNAFIDSIHDGGLNEYKMTSNPRGFTVIINNYDDDDDDDCAALENVFNYLGFQLSVNHNLTSIETKTLLTRLSEYDHSRLDCIAVCILTHGTVNVTEIVDCFEKCETLNGKPKLFFIQACQVDETIVVQPQSLPRGRDVSITYSTLDRQYKFIQSLCKVFHSYSTKHDLMSMLTLANGTIKSNQVAATQHGLCKKLFLRPVH
ncbi:caspase-7-like [Antedon mediterranea]|uniref:caspase-7-like n=1 Tax=Antedon mediterranea TaxID=105859 RepID=UPI003AF93A12